MDALDPGLVGRFWEQALGGSNLTRDPDGYETRVRVEGGPVLDVCVQQVPVAPSDPLRLHLDLSPGDDQQATVTRLLELGARHLDIGQGDVPWVVMADPEGTPFCVMEERAAYAGSGPVAALPLDSSDPDRDARLWSLLSGWTDVDGPAPRSLRHPCPAPSSRNRSLAIATRVKYCSSASFSGVAGLGSVSTQNRRQSAARSAGGALRSCSWRSS